MKQIKFVGSSLDDLRDFPDEARRVAGFELRAIQDGFEPRDWKAISSVGTGAKEVTKNKPAGYCFGSSEVQTNWRLNYEKIDYDIIGKCIC